MNSCIDDCYQYNFSNNKPSHAGITYNTDLTSSIAGENGNCFLESAIDTMIRVVFWLRALHLRARSQWLRHILLRVTIKLPMHTKLELKPHASSARFEHRNRLVDPHLHCSGKFDLSTLVLLASYHLVPRPSSMGFDVVVVLNMSTAWFLILLMKAWPMKLFHEGDLCLMSNVQLWSMSHYCGNQATNYLKPCRHQIDATGASHKRPKSNYQIILGIGAASHSSHTTGLYQTTRSAPRVARFQKRGHTIRGVTVAKSKSTVKR